MAIIGFISAFIFLYHFKNLHKVMETETFGKDGKLKSDLEINKVEA